MRDDAFRVTVTCEAGVWTAVVQGVPEATIQTCRLSALDPQVRNRLAELFDRPASSLVLFYGLRAEGCA